MAELLVKAKDNPGDDTQYKVGDVVVVQEDGWEWGTLEGPPDFNIIKVPGLSVEDVKFSTSIEYQNDKVKRIRSHKYKDGKIIDKKTNNTVKDLF